MVMARLSRPERPDLVFVSPQRSQGWPALGHWDLDAAGDRGRVAKGI